MRERQRVELTLALKYETDAAWLVFDHDPNSAVWIPKSRGELGRQVGTHAPWPVHEFEIDESVAYERGLI
jgi:hypothetical protein